MNHELICSWLGLPGEAWPPNHYRLLGLQPGENDPVLIEQHVRQRLDTVRRYQMCHPEQATEAMNRLAQALVCLTDPASRQRYDAEHHIPSRPCTPPPLPPTCTPTAASKDTVSTRPLETSDWQTPPPVQTWLTPPPVRASRGSNGALSNGELAKVTMSDAPTPPPLPIPTQVQTVAEPSVPAREPSTPRPKRKLAPRPAPIPITEKIHPADEAACSTSARRGLGTLRAVRRRQRYTLQLQHLWERLGVFLSTPRRLKDAAEEDQLADVLHELVALLRRFPPILGQAGQPAYLIASLARQEHVVQAFQDLTHLQRVALQRDWQTGQKLLQAYHTFLLGELEALRRLNWRQRLVKAGRALLADQPVLTVILCILVVGIAVLGSVYLPLWLRRR